MFFQRVAILLTWIVVTSTSGGVQEDDPECLPDYYQRAPVGEEAVKYAVAHGQLVLLGKIEFTHTCNDSTEFCGSRQTNFEVTCVLKSDGLPVANYISIGNQSFDQKCDLTYIPWSENGKMYIVIVKRDPSGANPYYNFDWDEVIPRTSAYVQYRYINVVMHVCGMTPSYPTDNEVTATCPARMESESCYDGSSLSWMDSPGFGRYRVSLAVRMSLADAETSCRSVGARLLYLRNNAELEALTALLPNKSGVTWWTSGTFQQGKWYWQDLIYGILITTNISTLLAPNGTLSGSQLLLTPSGWTTTTDGREKHAVICKLPPDGGVYDFLSEDFKPQAKLSVTYFMDTSVRWVCCNWIRFEKKLVNIEELETGMLQPYYMQNPPFFAVNVSRVFQKEKYTYLMVDISDPSDPYVHYLLTNANFNPDQANVVPVLNYKAPVPTTRSNFLFLVFKQLSGTIYVNPVAFSNRNCTDRPRCGFAIKKFAEENNLLLLDVTSVSAEVDEYVITHLIDSRQMSIVDACKIKWPSLTVHQKNLLCPSGNYDTDSAGSAGRTAGFINVSLSFLLLAIVYSIL